MIDVSGLDVRLKAIDEIRSSGLPVFIFGKGTYGGGVADYLKENGITTPISYVIDDDYYRTEEKEERVISMSLFLQKYSEKAILILGIYNIDFVKRFRKEYSSKIRHIYDFHMTLLGRNRVLWNREEAEDLLSAYNVTYEMLSDDKSRRTMYLYMRAAINGEFNDLYDNCYIPVSYFNEITEKSGIDTLIDCGAFDGDSIHDFVNIFPDYTSIYAIEPDKTNRENLRERIKKENILGVDIFPYGVYKETGILHFSNDGTSSAHIDRAGAECKVISIDNLVRDNCMLNEKILIKMDIEGSELDALKGAENTIKTYRPCLTVCVYHRERDLIDIPQYIRSLVDDTYEYRLGFHGKDLAELVFYAIPK